MRLITCPFCKHQHQIEAGSRYLECMETGKTHFLGPSVTWWEAAICAAWGFAVVHFCPGVLTSVMAAPAFSMPWVLFQANHYYTIGKAPVPTLVLLDFVAGWFMAVMLSLLIHVLLKML